MLVDGLGLELTSIPSSILQRSAGMVRKRGISEAWALHSKLSDGSLNMRHVCASLANESQAVGFSHRKSSCRISCAIFTTTSDIKRQRCMEGRGEWSITLACAEIGGLTQAPITIEPPTMNRMIQESKIQGYKKRYKDHLLFSFLFAPAGFIRLYRC